MVSWEDLEFLSHLEILILRRKSPPGRIVPAGLWHYREGAGPWIAAGVECSCCPVERRGEGDLLVGEASTNRLVEAERNLRTGCERDRCQARRKVDASNSVDARDSARDIKGERWIDRGSSHYPNHNTHCRGQWVVHRDGPALSVRGFAEAQVVCPVGPREKRGGCDCERLAGARHSDVVAIAAVDRVEAVATCWIWSR